MENMASLDPSKVDDFLEKIDEIDSIVKGFHSGDSETAREAMCRADKLIAEIDKKKKNKEIGYDFPEPNEEKEALPKTKTGFSKTIINKASDNDTPGRDDVNYEGMNQEAFMKAFEADAQARAARREARNKVAEEWKEKGNAEFRLGNFEKALEFYTEGLREAKDIAALYTNRAQCYIKLGKYENAFIDCEWALRCYPNCMKAHVHMGRAHIGMKEYKEARECFKKALTCDPTKDSLINDYLAEVDRAELAAKQEKAAEEIFQEGKPENMGVVEVLGRVQKPVQLPVFYSGGLRILKSLIQNTTDQTLFRTNGGLTLLVSMDTLRKCFSASPRSLSGEELDMLASAFDLFSAACQDNEKSSETFLQLDNISIHCTRFLEVSMKGQGRVLQHAITSCLFCLSQNEVGRRQIVSLFDIPKLLSVMFTLIRTSRKTSTMAANLLSNLALDKKFKSHLRDKVDTSVCPAFEQLLADSGSTAVLPRCIAMVTNLTGDDVIRGKLMKRDQLWEACCNVFRTHHLLQEDNSLMEEVVESVLGLLLNLSKAMSPCLEKFGVELCSKCLEMIKLGKCSEPLRVRGVGILSHILPHSDIACNAVVDSGGTEILLEYIKDERLCYKPALKALTAITKCNEAGRKYIVGNKGLGTLIKRLKSEDETIVGNAALCLSHCTQVSKVCALLTKTDIIKDLLVLARDGKKPAVQQNCAILIAKLAQGDSKHLERLRELHGVEILHSCMKYIK